MFCIFFDLIFPKTHLKMHFFTKSFGNIKKKQYLCSGFVSDDTENLGSFELKIMGVLVDA